MPESDGKRKAWLSARLLCMILEKKKNRIFMRFSYGGAEGTRTLYLIHAMDALSQVSYNPACFINLT